jgi:hypothetical protein
MHIRFSKGYDEAVKVITEHKGALEFGLVLQYLVEKLPSITDEHERKLILVMWQEKISSYYLKKGKLDAIAEIEIETKKLKQIFSR